MVKGELAKELFAQIRPDVKQEQACSSSADYRERRRGDIACVHTAGYECYFGLDLRTGKGTYGAICQPGRCPALLKPWPASWHRRTVDRILLLERLDLQNQRLNLHNEMSSHTYMTPKAGTQSPILRVNRVHWLLFHQRIGPP